MSTLKDHEQDYRANAWREYTLAELGNIVAFLHKRADHRSDFEKRNKDLDDAQNYLNMMQMHLDEAKRR